MYNKMILSITMIWLHPYEAPPKTFIMFTVLRSNITIVRQISHWQTMLWDFSFRQTTFTTKASNKNQPESVSEYESRISRHKRERAIEVA